MTRLALVLATVATLGTGCIVTNDTPPLPPSGSVDVGWRFARFAPGGTSPIAFYGCTSGGIDAVVVQFGSGGAQQVPCFDNAGDGGLFAGVPAGQQTITVIGRRSGHDLYRSSYTIDVVAGATTPTGVLDIDGIPDDLEVQTAILTANGTGSYTSCANAGFSSFSYKVVDSSGTTVAVGGPVGCTDANGNATASGFPDLRFLGSGALDRDTYTIRLQAPGSGSVTFDSASSFNACSGQSFGHFAPDTGSNAWTPAMYYVGGNGTLCL